MSATLSARSAQTTSLNSSHAASRASQPPLALQQEYTTVLREAEQEEKRFKTIEDAFKAEWKEHERKQELLDRRGSAIAKKLLPYVDSDIAYMEASLAVRRQSRATLTAMAARFIGEDNMEEEELFDDEVLLRTPAKERWCSRRRSTAVAAANAAEQEDDDANEVLPRTPTKERQSVRGESFRRRSTAVVAEEEEDVADPEPIERRKRAAEETSTVSSKKEKKAKKKAKKEKKQKNDGD